MCEKFFFFKKFGVRKIFFQEARYYKFVNFYILDSIVFKYTSTFSFLDLVKDKHYYTETSN
jgi:hypothetical protein